MPYRFRFINLHSSTRDIINIINIRVDQLDL